MKSTWSVQHQTMNGICITSRSTCKQKTRSNVMLQMHPCVLLCSPRKAECCCRLFMHKRILPCIVNMPTRHGDCGSIVCLSPLLAGVDERGDDPTCVVYPSEAPRCALHCNYYAVGQVTNLHFEITFIIWSSLLPKNHTNSSLLVCTAL